MKEEEAEKLNEEAKKAYKDKDFERAKECLIKAVNIYPIEGKYYHNLGILFLELKKYKEAVSYYSKAIEFGFELEKCYLGRGRAWSGLEEVEKAIQDYTEVLKINEDSFEARENRAIEYNNSEEYEKAVSDLTILLKKNPYDSILLLLRYAAYTNLGKSKEANRDLDDCDLESLQMNNPN